MTDDVGLRIIIEDDSKPAKAPPQSAASVSDVGFTIPTPATSRHVTDTFTQTRPWVQPPEAKPAGSRATADPITGKTLESFSAPREALGDGSNGAVVTSGRSPVDAQREAYETRLRHEQEEKEKSRAWSARLFESSRDFLSRRIGMDPRLGREASHLIHQASPSRTPTPTPKPEYDAGTGAWTMAGKTVPPPGWATGATEATAAGASEKAIQAGVGQAAGASGAGAGLAVAGLAAGCALATAAVIKLGSAASGSARELMPYSQEIAASQGRADLREIGSDIREAQYLGNDYSNVTDEYSALRSELRDLLLPIKKVGLEILAELLSWVREGIVVLKDIYFVFETMVKVIADVFTFNFGEILTDIRKGLEKIANNTTKDPAQQEIASVMNRFFDSADNMPDYKGLRDALSNFGDSKLNIPAFAGL